MKGAIGVIELDHPSRRGRGHRGRRSSTASGCGRSATSIYAMPPVRDRRRGPRADHATRDGGGAHEDRRDRHRHRASARRSSPPRSCDARDDAYVKPAQTGDDDDARDRARALRRRRPHARPLPRAARARDAPPRAPGVPLHHAARDRRLRRALDARPRRRSRAPAACSCASATTGTIADVAELLDAPLIVVARAGLGTLNHTALTVEAIERRGLHCLGHRDRLAGRATPTSPRSATWTTSNAIAPVLGRHPRRRCTDLNLEIPA